MQSALYIHLYGKKILVSEVYPDDLVTAADGNITRKENSGGGLECLLCRKIVQQLDEFLTAPNFTENVCLTNCCYKLIIFAVHVMERNAFHHRSPNS